MPGFTVLIAAAPLLLAIASATHSYNSYPYYPHHPHHPYDEKPNENLPCPKPNEHWEPCDKACQEICGKPEPFCPEKHNACKDGGSCTCDFGFIRDSHGGRCIPKDHCTKKPPTPPPQPPPYHHYHHHPYEPNPPENLPCPKQHEHWGSCNNACQEICGKLEPFCPKDEECHEGGSCICDFGYVREEFHGGRCILKDHCTKKPPTPLPQPPPYHHYHPHPYEPNPPEEPPTPPPQPPPQPPPYHDHYHHHPYEPNPPENLPCSKQHEHWEPCNKACQEICGKQEPFCPKDEECHEGGSCICDFGYVREEFHGGRCILKDHCTKKPPTPPPQPPPYHHYHPHPYEPNPPEEPPIPPPQPPPQPPPYHHYHPHPYEPNPPEKPPTPPPQPPPQPSPYHDHYHHHEHNYSHYHHICREPNAHWSFEANWCCQPNCIKPHPICTKACIQSGGCVCKPGFIRLPVKLHKEIEDSNKQQGLCVPIEECSPYCGKNEIFKQCANLACEKACNRPHPICPKICLPPGGCTCDEGFVRQRYNDSTSPCIKCDSCHYYGYDFDHNAKHDLCFNTSPIPIDLHELKEE